MCIQAPCNLHINQVDPTRTITLRNRFVSDMRRRFTDLGRVVWQSIVDNDCFGLDHPSMESRGLFQAAAPERAFAFERSADKIAAFMDWLEQQHEEYILSGGQRGIRVIGDTHLNSWANVYVDAAYQRGIRRARAEMRKQGIPVPDYGDELWDDGSDEIAMVFNQPFHADRVGLLYTRLFRDLKGITQALDTLISRVLSMAMAEGRNPRDIARMLDKIITGGGGSISMYDSLGRFISGKRRAEILARTEIIRAHHLATIEEYRRAGLIGVTVLAEWSTAGDGRVCPDCAAMGGRIYSLDKIEWMIPLHPQCRCVALPYMEGITV